MFASKNQIDPIVEFGSKKSILIQNNFHSKSQLLSKSSNSIPKVDFIPKLNFEPKSQFDPKRLFDSKIEF